MTTKPEKRDGVDTGRPIARVVAGVLTLDLVSSWHYLAIFWTSDSPELLSVVSAFFALRSRGSFVFFHPAMSPAPPLWPRMAS